MLSSKSPSTTGRLLVPTLLFIAACCASSNLFALQNSQASSPQNLNQSAHRTQGEATPKYRTARLPRALNGALNPFKRQEAAQTPPSPSKTRDIIESASPQLAAPDAPATLEPAPLQNSAISIPQSEAYYPNEVSGGNAEGVGTLAQVEQLVLANHPAVKKVQSEIQALRGKHLQAGLNPNPKVGVIGDDIFDESGSGRYGVYYGREVIRGNKLELAQRVVDQEIDAAEKRLKIVCQRLLTDVRMQYYDILFAERKIELAQRLVELFENAVSVTNALVEAKEAAKTSVLQAELELQTAKVARVQAENELRAARRKLATMINEVDLPFAYLEGDIENEDMLIDFDQAFEVLVQNSPEVAELQAKVEQAKRKLNVECARPIPNVTWQAGASYDTVSDSVVGNFNIGMPLPTTNRNQGAISQARHSISAAQQMVDQKLLELRQSLATAYQAYQNAEAQIEAYEEQILPKSQETMELVTAGYREGEVSFLQLLTSQRTFSQARLAYLQQLRELRRRMIHVQGLLLSGSAGS